MPTFQKHEHLLTPAEFQAVYNRRRSLSDLSIGLIIYARENEQTHSRYGLSVSRKEGKAVVRNRIRRLLREAIRLEKATLPSGLDIVIVTRSFPLDTPLGVLREAISRLIHALSRRLAKERNPRASGKGSHLSMRGNT